MDELQKEYEYQQTVEGQRSIRIIEQLEKQLHQITKHHYNKDQLMPILDGNNQIIKFIRY